MDVGDKPRRAGTDNDARHQVAHQRRHLDAFRQESENECNAKACGDRSDECKVVVHLRARETARWPLRPSARGKL
ncbi:hypothetical protein D9M70_383800 [compost metagenome]